MTLDPGYFQKSLNLFVAICPSTRLTRAPPFLLDLVKPLFDTAEPVLKVLNINRMLPPDPAGAYLCGWFTPLCELMNHYLATSN